MKTKRRILVICQDYIGKSMAGPAIRSWEFANSLTKENDVTLLCPNKPSISPKKFKIRMNTRKALLQGMRQSDVLISQKITPKIARLAKKHQTRLILDAYDIISIESLEANRPEKMRDREIINKILLIEQSFSFIYADGIICASEKQRDYCIGVLSTLNRIVPLHYDKDNSLRKIIDVVPFGLSSTAPVKTKSNILNKKFGIKETDFVLLWGGGIWNWFDPLTLIEAVNKTPKSANVRLVFMGIDHPNKYIPRMAMVKKAIDKATKLGLINKKVFFNEGWVPYDERKDFLCASDIGVSMHFDHLETRFSFRTRILDYIWAGLPIISTKGDSFADLIEKKCLGTVVDYNDSVAISQAIVALSIAFLTIAILGIYLFG